MVRVKIKCRKCGYETQIDLQPSPNPLRPDKRAKGLKIKYSKEDLDKILDAAQGTSLDELAQLGVQIKKNEFQDAEERVKIKKFIRENVIVSKDTKKGQGEQVKLGTDDFRMGDKLSEVNLPASEIASMGVDDLRLIPGVTMKKNTYITIPGQEREVLRGIKYITFLDVSGSMFDPGNFKIGKALSMCEETWRICKKLNFDYKLAIFTDYGAIIPDEELERFFIDERYRGSFRMSGGTSLTSALRLFTDEHYKDANLLFISDMELGDVSAVIEKMKEIALLTKSFKIIMIKHKGEINQKQVDEMQSWFPEKEVLVMGVEVGNEEDI